MFERRFRWEKDRFGDALISTQNRETANSCWKHALSSRFRFSICCKTHYALHARVQQQARFVISVVGQLPTDRWRFFFFFFFSAPGVIGDFLSTWTIQKEGRRGGTHRTSETHDGGRNRNNDYSPATVFSRGSRENTACAHALRSKSCFRRTISFPQYLSLQRVDFHLRYFFLFSFGKCGIEIERL